MPNGAISRRSFLAGAAASSLAAPSSLSRQIGITTSSLDRHLSAGIINLFELPFVLTSELDMRVIDLNTTTLGAASAAGLDRLRREAEQAGCVLTNLKINRRELDMASPEPETRRYAIAEYKKSIDVAAMLGCRWARPLPLDAKPDMTFYLESYRRLADYAAERGVTMLVENWGWMQDDPNAIPSVVQGVGKNIAASPDIGNWTTDAVRYEALDKAFPLAVTCDFKFFELGPDGAHERYDLRRCFRTAWKHGFQGPWCFEHTNTDRDELFRELAVARELLRRWMASEPQVQACGKLAQEVERC